MTLRTTVISLGGVLPKTGLSRECCDMTSLLRRGDFANQQTRKPEQAQRQAQVRECRSSEGVERFTINPD